MVAARTVAVKILTPGIVANRWLTWLEQCQTLISPSKPVISSSNRSICRTKQCSATRATSGMLR